MKSIGSNLILGIVVSMLCCSDGLADDTYLQNIVLYKPIDEAGKFVVAVPAIKIELPEVDHEQISNVDLNSGFHVRFLHAESGQKNHVRLVTPNLPISVEDALKTADVKRIIDQICTWNWKHQLLFDDGSIEIPIGGEKTVFAAPEGEYFQAVTPHLNGDHLAAILRHPGIEQNFIVGLDLSHGGAISWRFPVDNLNADSLISWIDNDYILTTFYGRKFSAFSVIDLKKKSIVLQQVFDPAVHFLTKAGQVFTVNGSTGALDKIFPTSK